ncbi:MAG TPA: OsmC family protein [Jatrophihabitans sp.]|jgi:uncharacterized OsmC-like protein|nr:OsmC family protein [Jatrophihabitans sp.]
MGQFEVVVGAGSLRSPDGTRFPHRWTADGVTVDAEFTGAHLLHLAAAGCVLNDMYREAAGMGIRLDGVRASATGDFDTEGWTSTGINYTVDVDSSATAEDIARLLEVVDAVAEIPRALRVGATVERTSS